MRNRRILSAVLLCLLVLCSPVAWPGEADHLVMLHINDTHGQLRGTEEGGGAARLATKVREIRGENRGRVILLHAGDLLSRGDVLTVHYGGRVNYEVMNRLGFDAYAPGNGEFYFGLANMLEQVRHAKFPVLHANIASKRTGEALFQPTCIIKRAGLQIGVLGIGLVRMNFPGAASTLLWRDPLDAARTHVPRLREVCDIVVVLSHLGPGEDRRIAETVPGIDFILGGHDHSNPAEPVHVPWSDGAGEAVLVRAGDYYKRLGRLDVALTPTDEGVTVRTVGWQLIPLDASISEDKRMVRLLDRRLKPLRKEVICTLAEPLSYSETGPSNAGHAAAEAIRLAAGADLGLLDRGAVVGGLPAGEVTLADLPAVHPWRNHVVVAEMTGAEVQRAVKEGGLLFSGVLKQIDPAKRYRVAMGDYGHATTEGLSSFPVTPTGVRVDEALADHLAESL